MKTKFIILMIVMFSPLIYYFEVTRAGNWDLAYLKDDIVRVFARTINPTQGQRTPGI